MKLYHDTFDLQIHCEEAFTSDPAELNEVNRLMAEPEPEWDGYSQWSEELEASAWQGAQAVSTPHGPVMVKPQCERTGAHRDCAIYKCERAHREGGFDL